MFLGIAAAKALRLLCHVPASSANGRKPVLTLREREYIVLACRSPEPTVEEMADHMHLSPNTVRVHCAKVHRKLDVHTQMEIYIKALDMGLVRCRCCGQMHAGPHETNAI